MAARERYVAARVATPLRYADAAITTPRAIDDADYALRALCLMFTRARYADTRGGDDMIRARVVDAQCDLPRCRRLPRCHYDAARYATPSFFICYATPPLRHYCYAVDAVVVCDMMFRWRDARY